jgi:hypothetical protein
MTSLSQKEASRANGKLSRGPKTESGKRRSSQNAVRHGLRSARLDAATEARVAETLLLFTELHQPQTAIERSLVERMALFHARHLIAVEKETALIAAEVERQSPERGPKDGYVRIFHAVAALIERDTTLEALNRYASQFSFRYERAFSRLEAVKKSSFRRTNPTQQYDSAERTHAARK